MAGKKGPKRRKATVRAAKNSAVRRLVVGEGFDFPPEGTPEFRKLYEEYLRSPQWRRTRQKYFASIGNDYRCQACKTDERPTQLHHRTYARLGREQHADLVAVCDACHQGIHDVDRDRGDLSLAEATDLVIHQGGMTLTADEHEGVPKFVPMNQRPGYVSDWRNESRTLPGQRGNPATDETEGEG